MRRLVTITRGSPRYGQSHCVLRTIHLLVLRYSFIKRIVGIGAMLWECFVFLALGGATVRENKPCSSSGSSAVKLSERPGHIAEGN